MYELIEGLVGAVLHLVLWLSDGQRSREQQLTKRDHKKCKAS
jgi:hypothetical protein